MTSCRSRLLWIGSFCVFLAQSPLDAGAVSRQGSPAEASSLDVKGLVREFTGIPPEDRMVQGIAFDPSGRPLCDIAVTVVGPSWAEAITNGEGKFKLVFPPRMAQMPGSPVPYLIARDLQHNLAVALEFDPAAAKELRIQLVPGAILSGQVTDAQGGGLPGARMSLTFRSAQVGYGLRENAQSDANGRYEIRAVPAGYNYSVGATAKGYGQTSVRVYTADAMNDRMELEPIVLQVANLDIRGAVVDARGKPVQDARVSCYGSGQPNRQTQTDAEGRFVIREVCAGVIDIQANTSTTRANGVAQAALYGSVRTQGGAADVKVVATSVGYIAPSRAARPGSLVGQALPALSSVGIKSPVDAYNGSRVLLCFFDANQRPSRHCLAALAQRAEGLKQEGVTLIPIQATETDADVLKKWLDEQGIRVPVGQIASEADPRTTLLLWGVRSLPWLILTDARHVVQAEGFALDALDAKIEIAKP